MLELLEKLAIETEGSGFCKEGDAIETPSFFKQQMSYHCIDDAGYYVGYAYFTIKIKKSDIQPDNTPLVNLHALFALEFNGTDGQYLNNRYMLRDFIEDTLCCSLDRLSK